VAVEFRFSAKESRLLVYKGQVIARQQFIVKPYQFPKIESQTAKVQKEETESYVKFDAAGTTLTVGKWSGWIDYLDVDGKPMLCDHQSIVPEFWRAPTDNDYGAGLQHRLGVWKNPQMKLKECKVDGNTVTSTFDMPSVKATLVMTYTLTAEGEVIVRQQLKADKDAKVAPMFRYGMQLQMPKEFNAVSYYGRGPVENYIDRNSSEFIGFYENKVADEYYSYVRPQESGNHTDIRWFRVFNAEGKGLEFYSNAPMEASALNFLTEDLDDGVTKDKVIGRHSGDLIERPLTQVHIQQRQMGLGCVNSWGAWPRAEYQMPYKDYDFTFAIRPIK
jgi:beta-galactosidase